MHFYFFRLHQCLQQVQVQLHEKLEHKPCKMNKQLFSYCKNKSGKLSVEILNLVLCHSYCMIYATIIFENKISNLAIFKEPNLW